MELFKLTADELKGYDAVKLRETETAIRHQLVNIRMDIYTPLNQHTGKIRGLRKALARVLTLKGAQAKVLVVPVAKAAKVPAVKKTAVAKAKPVAKTKTATKK
jgi:ribosomal protein L29